METILLLAAVPFVVWGAVVFVRGGLLGGALAVLVGGTVFGHAFFNLPAGPIPLTVDRVLWLVLLIQYAVWRQRGLADPKPLGREELAFFAFLGVLAASTLTHDWTAHNNQPLARLLFCYVMPAGMYWVARQGRVTERGVQVVFGSLAVLGIYLAATAVAESQRCWWAVFPTYIGSNEFPLFLGRARGPLLNPSANGLLMTACLGCLLVWWPRLNRPGRLMLVLLTGLFGAAFYATLTRCVWLGAGSGLLLILGLSLPRAWRFPVLGGIVLTGTLLVAANWDSLMSFQRDEGLSAKAAADSVKLRPVLARVAWNMFCERPLLGCGFAQYLDESVNYLHDRTTELNLESARPYSQHNVFLSLLTETGLVGMCLWAILLWFWARDAWRLWQNESAPPWFRRAGLVFLVLLVAYLANGTFQDISVIGMVNMYLMFTAGLVSGLSHNPAVARPIVLPISH